MDSDDRRCKLRHQLPILLMNAVVSKFIQIVYLEEVIAGISVNP
jgi:hypothetical protein